MGFFVNYRYEWSVTDYPLQVLGAVSVPRGSDTTSRDVQFIFHHSDSVILILETVSQLVDLADAFTVDDWKRSRNILIVEKPAGVIPDKLSGKILYCDNLFFRGRELSSAEN